MYIMTIRYREISYPKCLELTLKFLVENTFKSEVVKEEMRDCGWKINWGNEVNIRLLVDLFTYLLRYFN